MVLTFRIFYSFFSIERKIKKIHIYLVNYLYLIFFFIYLKYVKENIYTYPTPIPVIILPLKKDAIFDPATSIAHPTKFNIVPI